ncbi:NADH dehydrogenase [Aureococcus anophagefferens]|nr:NADH dehydrogenase [Aureococcus anophagefferens]
MGGGHHEALPEGPATRKEMSDAGLLIAYRDACAHLLIPLNKCRRQTFYMPWECGHYRHEYEKCQYVEWLKRSKDETVAAPAIEKGYAKALDHGHDGH